jgi:hypothetical protein
MRKPATLVFVLIVFAAGASASLSSLMRPRVLPASGPQDTFSAERAMAHVSALSQAPHPPGSAEIDRVRAAIVAELEALGLEPEIQSSSITLLQGSSATGSAIHNIVARIPGSDSTQAILLDAHYDTRAMTPGAADCSSCVAILLETARALQAGPQLRNDVILVFTDNEEYGGGLGAGALIRENDWIENVGLALNFEGLGSTGPSILFETGPQSGWAVREWARAAHLPAGQSWFQEIYGRTPIGTDLDWYAEQGIPGMNFGFWAKGTSYHSVLDNPQTLDPRSLQHQGETALSLVWRFGNLDLNAARSAGGSKVYFSLVRGLTVHYKTAWALPLVLVCGLLLSGVAARGLRGVGLRGKQLSVRGTLKGLGAFVLSLVLSAGLSTGLWMGAAQLHGEYQSMLTFRGMVYNAPLYFAAFVALAVAIAAALLVLFRAKTSVIDLVFGALIFWWLLALATGIAFPGFSYLFTWPTLFFVLAMVWILWRDPPEGWAQIVWTLGALPGLVLMIPGLYVMFQFALSPMIGILSFMVSLLLGLLIPQIDALTRSHRWRLPAIAGAACVAFLVAGSLTAGFTPARPRPNAVAYLLDADRGAATWFSAGTQQDEWTAQFFETAPQFAGVGKLFPIARRSGFPVMRGDAPAVALEAPQVELGDDRTSNGVRTVQLNVRSPRGAPVLLLDIEPYAAVRAVTVEGDRMESVESTRDLWSLTYYALPPEGIDVLLELDPVQPVTIQASDQTWEPTPEVLASLSAGYQPRTDEMMPMPNFDYGTVVARTLFVD